MKIQFDSQQEYQLEAVQAVTDLFVGQPKYGGQYFVGVENKEKRNEALFVDSTRVIPNILQLDNEQIIDNLHSIQEKNNLSLSEKSVFSIGDGQALNIGDGHNLITGDELAEGMNFSIEMETGTGKTYVYLRTIHELYQKYGMRKFVIVVPSVAIREGVLKNLQITKEHFANLYNNPEMDFYVWDPKKKGQMQQFATANALQIMVINIDSFAKEQNVINQSSDYGRPMEFLQATNPIVIVDEPQNMETEKRKVAIDSLNPLCTLRYSATHKNIYNLVYKLDPVQAYDLGLVKKIEVDSIVSEDAYNEAYIRVMDIRATKTKVEAKIEIDKSDERGLQRKEILARVGDDLREYSEDREVYEGFVIDEINPVDKSVTFANGKTYYKGQRDEGLQDEITKYQIRQTVQNHFEKEKKLQGRGVKVLTLFFIDKVHNYREYADSGIAKGKFARWFEEAYRELQQQERFKGVMSFAAEDVHNGYFSADNNKQWKDTKGTTKADDDTYQLIMKDKERLLGIEEPLRFIFSHSALREGWDNPNVFNICTINETASEMKKRQEIGRGLRLPVDQYGERIYDNQVNILTVVANESYDEFANKLQSELEEDCGVRFGSERIKNKSKRKTIKLKKGYNLDENFKALWEKIKLKTRYRVEYQTDDLIERSVEEVSNVSVRAPRVTSQRARIDINHDGVSGMVVRESGQDVSRQLDVIPDVLGSIQGKTGLTKETIFQILKQSCKLPLVFKNPQALIDEVSERILYVLNSLMIEGVKYEKVSDEVYDMRAFENKQLEGYLESLVEVSDQEKTLYDHVLVDSDIERQFAKDLEARENVKFYFKLPGWFKIATPVGSYNPDWAVVLENDEQIYFVAETKGTNRLEELKNAEKQKIICGFEHFRQLDNVDFIAPVDSLSKAFDKYAD